MSFTWAFLTEAFSIVEDTPISACLVHSAPELPREQRGGSFDRDSQKIVSGEGSVHLSWFQG